MTEDLRGDNIIDSRDVNKRIEHLQGEIQGVIDTVNESRRKASEEAGAPLPEVLEPDLDNTEFDLKLTDSAFDDVKLEIGELLDLLNFRGQAALYCPDWRYGSTLVREDHFPDYIREYVSDIGDMPREVPGYMVIDWDATADNLRVDYTTVEFNGENYLVR